MATTCCKAAELEDETCLLFEFMIPIPIYITSTLNRQSTLIVVWCAISSRSLIHFDQKISEVFQPRVPVVYP